MSAGTYGQRKAKTRRNVSLDADVDDWLGSPEGPENASKLINDLLLAYRAYGEASKAIEYVEQRDRQRPLSSL